MEDYDNYSEKPKKRGTGRKILTTLSIIIVLAAAVFVFFKFFYVFGSGVKAGETVTYTYKVIQPLERRVGAKLVPEYALNLTPESELEKLRAPVETFFITRDRGAGRPTKKDRREIEEAWDAIDFNDIPDDIAARFGLTEEDL